MCREILSFCAKERVSHCTTLLVYLTELNRVFVLDDDFALVAHDREQVTGFERIEQAGHGDDSGNAVFSGDDEGVRKRAAAFGEYC